MHLRKIQNRMQKPPVLSMLNRKGADSYCILTPAKLQQAAHYINFKMENPGLLLMQAKGCLKQPRTTQSQN